MSKKISISIERKDFDVDVSDDFAEYLEMKLLEDFDMQGNNGIKTLLKAYIKKNYELYMQDKNIENLLQKCENLG